MNIIPVKLEEMEKLILELGFAGENMCTGFSFACDSVFSKYPDAIPSMAVTPPKGSKYPVVVTRDGNNVLWNVTDSDTAYMGNGEVQLIFTQNNVVKRSYTCRTRILKSIIAEGTPPDPVQSWIDSANEMLAEIPGTIDTAIDEAIAAAKASGEFKGDPGFSPVVTTAPISGGNSVTITDEQGNHTFNVLNGTNGVSPDLSVTDITNGHRVTITDASGTNTFDVMNGENGVQIDDTTPSATKTYSSEKVDNELSLISNDIQGKYTKPSGGIPASDIADGVIPVVDSALSDSSENTIQNKVVKGALDTKAPAIINAATGNPAVFNDGGGMPIKSLLIPFTPIQSGTGDPSPENIRPILPWNGLTVFGGGKNLLNVDDSLKLAFSSAYSNWSGENGTVTITGRSTGGYITPCKANTKYAYSFNPTYRGDLLAIRVYEFSDYPQRLTDGTLIYNGSSNANRPPITCTTSANAKWLVVGFYVHDISENIILRDMQFEVGQTATAYEPYVPITDTDIVFPSPVYGGTLDVVSGVLTVEWGAKIFDGSADEGWERRPQGSASAFAMKATISGIKDISNVTSIKANYLKTLSANETWGNYDNWISQIGEIIVTGIQSITTVEAWTAYLAENPLIVVYEFATPQTVQLTPTQLTALIGNNTIWSDTDGQMTVEYPADTKTYIDNLIATAIASL